MKLKFLIIGLFSTLNYSCSQSLECADLLERYAKKPEKVEFIECQRGTGQTILEAQYKVSGKDSEEIENFLTQEYGMGKLKFICCGWEPIDGKNGTIENPKLKELDNNLHLVVLMYANAEKKDGTGIEFDRTKVDFNLVVKLLRI